MRRFFEDVYPGFLAACGDEVDFEIDENGWIQPIIQYDAHPEFKCALVSVVTHASPGILLTDSKITE